MKVPYEQLFLLALWSLAVGFFYGFVYEWFRLLHRSHPRLYILIFFEDLLYCLLCALAMMLLFFNLSYGKMRFYSFLLVIAGFLLWYFLAGKLFRRFLSALHRLLSPVFTGCKLYFVYRFRKKQYLLAAKHGFLPKRISKKRFQNEERAHHVEVT